MYNFGLPKTNCTVDKTFIPQFQDKDNLYFVMEYIPGGDLMSMLIKEGRFTESLAR